MYMETMSGRAKGCDSEEQEHETDVRLYTEAAVAPTRSGGATGEGGGE